MFVDYPYEWTKYMVEGKVRTFKRNTPDYIIEQAKKINTKSIKTEQTPYFFFE